MTKISLPENSKFVKGDYYKSENNNNIKKNKIYRWNPDTKSNPKIDTFEINLDQCGQMVLDLSLIHISEPTRPY